MWEPDHRLFRKRICMSHIIKLLVLFFCISKNANFNMVIISDLSGRVISLLVGMYFCKEVIVQHNKVNSIVWKEIKQNIIAGSQLMFANLASSCIIGVVRYGIQKNWSIAIFGKISLTSLKIMEVMMARKKKLSELSEGFTVYPQVLTNVRVTDKKAAQDDADVQAAVKKVTEELGDTGRILVRESGTEPVVRVMVEAESEEICQKYVDMVVNVIKENGYVAG